MMDILEDTHPWDRVRGIIPTSFCDWPGHISCVLFVGGCNFLCPTCHNSGLAWDWKSMPSLDKKATLADLRGRKRWLDGITVSGGEPTSTPGLLSILEDLATVGLPIKLDSNGSAPLILEHLLRHSLIQALAIDVKGPWEMYPELTGGTMSAGGARRSLERVFALATTYPGQIYFRCTKVPGLTEFDLEVVRTQVPSGLELIFQDFIEPEAATKQKANAAQF